MKIEWALTPDPNLADSFPPYANVKFDTLAEAQQTKVLLDALEVYAKRNEKYSDNWKRMGWRGMLIRIRERAERLWDAAWDAEPGYPHRNVPPVETDDAIDLINFAAFYIRAVSAGNRDGSWWGTP